MGRKWHKLAHRVRFADDQWNALKDFKLKVVVRCLYDVKCRVIAVIEIRNKKYILCLCWSLQLIYVDSTFNHSINKIRKSICNLKFVNWKVVSKKNEKVVTDTILTIPIKRWGFVLLNTLWQWNTKKTTITGQTFKKNRQLQSETTDNIKIKLQQFLILYTHTNKSYGL